MLKKNIILAFLFFNLLNYSSQLFASVAGGGSAGPGDEMADADSNSSVSASPYLFWDNARKLQTNSAGDTELHQACNNHSLLSSYTGYAPESILSMLIAKDNDAHPTAASEHKNLVNLNGNTPLHEMCSYCFDHETTLLTRDEIKKMLPLLITPENINIPNNDGNTPFHLACMHGYQYIIEALMGSPITRPNLHLKNRVGLTPINCLPIHETMLNIRNFIIRNTYSRRPVGS